MSKLSLLKYEKAFYIIFFAFYIVVNSGTVQLADLAISRNCIIYTVKGKKRTIRLRTWRESIAWNRGTVYLYYIIESTFLPITTSANCTSPSQLSNHIKVLNYASITRKSKRAILRGISLINIFRTRKVYFERTIVDDGTLFMPVASLGGWELSLKNQIFGHLRRFLDFCSIFSTTARYFAQR